MTHFKSHLGIGVTALALLVAGCGGGGGGPSDPRIPAENTPSDGGGSNSNVGGEQETFCTSESTVFEVSEFVPENGEQGVALNRSIRVTFNADVDAATV
ncbi:MAG: Ig-like domain-containing protein, partial [Marinobacter sp.]